MNRVLNYVTIVTMKGWKMMSKILMNPHTGSVDTEENWQSEGWNKENSTLIEVELINNSWVEMEEDND